MEFNGAFYGSRSPEVWDQKFLEHHFIAIAGYASSEIANVFGLANAVNTWITEVRSSRPMGHGTTWNGGW